MPALQDIQDALARHDVKGAALVLWPYLVEQLSRAERQRDEIVRLIHDRRDSMAAVGESGKITECSQHMVAEYGILLSEVQSILEQ